MLEQFVDGAETADLKAAAFESPAKHKELCALLASYEQFLVANHRGDVAAVYEEAIKHPDWCPIQPQDCWTELPDVNWTPLQRSLIDSMPGERISLGKSLVVGHRHATAPDVVECDAFPRVRRGGGRGCMSPFRSCAAASAWSSTTP